jgi:glycosyltransferase involved in cell wall biosynthesis
MMFVYNEADVIEQVIAHMASQRIPLVVIDNGSTDGTYETLKRSEGSEILELDRIITDKYYWARALQTLYNRASAFEPDWMLRLDADEFLEAPWKGVTLGESIEREHDAGYNLIQFDDFEFWPTDNDDLGEKDLRKRIRHYSWNDCYQFIAWRNYENTDIWTSGGHLPIFPKGTKVNLCPTRYVLRHYEIRGYEHGVRKVQTRLARYSEEDKRRWNLEKKYLRFGQERSAYIIPAERLNRYEENGQWNRTRKFDGHRGYDLPVITKSEDVERLMNEARSGSH